MSIPLFPKPEEGDSTESAEGSWLSETKPLPGGELGPGRRFGEFRIVRELGRGGFGVVYLAEQERPARQVALKVLPAVASPRTGELERFRREADNVGKVQCDHVVRVYTAGVEEGHPYLAMEYVEGAPLSRLIPEGGLDPRRAAALARQVAIGLSHAHERKVLHRDLKPDNVLVRAPGTPDERALLSDFGLSRAPDDPTITGSGRPLGTPLYMSPEQARGTPEDIDERTDVYGLGSTLYHMLTGRPGRERAAFEDVLIAAMLRDPPRPTRLQPRIPVELERIVLRAMSRNRSARYPTAAALAADLEAFLDGSLAARGVAGARRRAALTAVAGALAIGLAFAARSLLAGGGTEPAPPGPARPAAPAGRPETIEEALGRHAYDRAWDAFADRVDRGEALDPAGRWTAWGVRRRFPGGAVVVDEPDATALALSPDGTRLATTSRTAGLAVHDLSNGTRRAYEIGRDATAVWFVEGGAAVLVWTGRPGVDAGRLDRVRLEDGAATSLAPLAADASVAPEGRSAMWREGAGGPIRLAKLGSAEPPQAIDPGLRGTPRLGPNGLVLFDDPAGEGSISAIYDLGSKTPRLGPAGPAAFSILSPDSLRMARIETDRSVRVADVQSVRSARLAVRAREIEWAGDRLAVVEEPREGADHATISLWEPVRGVRVASAGVRASSGAWAVSRDGTRLAAVWPDGRICALPIPRPRWLADDSVELPAIGAEFSPSGGVLVQVRSDAGVWAWDVREDRLLGALAGSDGASIGVADLAVLDDERVLVRFEDRRLALWRPRGDSLEDLAFGAARNALFEHFVRELRPEAGPVVGDAALREVAYASRRAGLLGGLSIRGERLSLLPAATGRSADTEILLADVATLAFDEAESAAFAVDREGRLLAFAADGRTMARVDLREAVPAIRVAHVASADGGRTVIVGGAGGWAVVDLATGRPLLVEPTDPLDEQGVDCLAISPDGRLLAVGSQGWVQLVDLSIR